MGGGGGSIGGAVRLALVYLALLALALPLRAEGSKPEPGDEQRTRLQKQFQALNQEAGQFYQQGQ